MFRRNLFLCLIFLFLTISIYPTNYKGLKKEIDIFSQILNTSLKESVYHPLLVSDPPRGAYLDGYGVVFHATLNLNRISILALSSRGNKKVSHGDSDVKTLIAKLKRNVVDTISQYGNGFKLLPSNEKICIIIHVLKRNLMEGKNLDKVLVIGVRKKDVDSFITKNITFENFKKRIKYIEY